MRYLLVLLGLILANTAEASIDCSKQPDCASLGFVKTDDDACATDGYVYCPFDHTYKKCVERDCAKLGFTNTDKTSWCGKLTKCSTNETYTLCRALCEVGDVYYSNGTCGYADEYDPQDQSKKPVGVVYWVTDNGRHGKVINLKRLTTDADGKFHPDKPYNFSSADFRWGLSKAIPGLQIISCQDFLEIAPTEDRSHDFWSAGKKNTDIIAAAQNDDLQYPAPAAKAFYPYSELKDNPKVGAGHWYLPTIGEMMDLYGYNYKALGEKCEGTTGGTGTTIKLVQNALNTLSEKGVDAAKITGWYWVSAPREYNTNAWNINVSTGERNDRNQKTDKTQVRVSLEF